jgi:hypothetical protein
MPTASDLKASAEAKFKKKELQRLDGRAAMVEYEAAGRATVDKTARLKALRLSQAQSAPPIAAKPVATKPKRRSKAAPKAASV